MNLKGSIALVTGAGRGIGRAIALSLAKEGAEVVLTARTVAELGQVKKEIELIGGKALAIPADLTNDSHIGKLFEEVSSKYARLDILVNNAGIGVFAPVRSLAGRNAFVGGAGYAATKWALIGFSRSLMLEVREQNIRVITICPGSVDTSFSPTPKEPSRSEKILHPQDVADTILSALMLPDRAMVSEIDIRPTNLK